MNKLKVWFKHIRDRLVDKLAILIWEGFCRLALSPEIPDWSPTLRDMRQEIGTIKPEIDLLKKQLTGLDTRFARLSAEFQKSNVALDDIVVVEPRPVTIQLDIGRTEGVNKDLTHVEFCGEQLAEAQSSAGDFRMQEALYRTQSGKLLVHTKTLEKVAGFPTQYSLYEIEEIDLGEGGLHEELGRAWGTLSLAETLGGE